MKHSTLVWRRLCKPPWRTITPVCLFLLFLICVYAFWHPGAFVTNGRHDRLTNAIWLQHGWLGDDEWFTKNQKSPTSFRDPRQIQKMATLLSTYHIKYVYPHLCPCNPNGQLPGVDEQQADLFCKKMSEFRILPWIGGVLDKHVFLKSHSWQNNFIQSCLQLLETYPEFAGVHINIEPMPTGNQDFIQLLEELKQQMPKEKILSVAAYPPPTYWQPNQNVHWNEAYFSQVASHVDQIVVMMYDTGLNYSKVYQSLMANWTRDVLLWSDETDVLLGIPTYTDVDVYYHNPKVENIENALCGIHAGLSSFTELPHNYHGIAIYCEWETEPVEWSYLQNNFLNITAPKTPSCN